MDRIPPRPYCNDPNDDSPTKCSLVAFYYKNTISERAWVQQVRDWESKPWKKSMLPFPEYIAHMADREIVDHARGIRYHLCEQNADIDGNPYPCDYGSEKCYHADPRKSQSVREIEAAPSSKRSQRQIEAPPQRSELSRREYSSRDNDSSRGKDSSRGNDSSRSGYTKRMNEMSPSKKAQIDELLKHSTRGADSGRSVSSSGELTIKRNDSVRGDSSRRNDSSKADSARGNDSSRSGYSQRMSEIDPSKKALIDELLGKSVRGNDSARSSSGSNRSSSSSKSTARPSERSNQTPRPSSLRNEVMVRAAGISESKRGSTTGKAAAGTSKLKQITYAGEDESLKRSNQSVTSSDGRSLKMLGYSGIDELKEQ